MVFGRPINDFILILPGSYEPHNIWIETSQAREEAMRARTVRSDERLIDHTVRLQPFKLGTRPVSNPRQVTIHCDGIQTPWWSEWNDSTSMPWGGWFGQGYPESENSQEVRQDRIGPHIWYCPHHQALTNYQQLRKPVSCESTNSSNRTIAAERPTHGIAAKPEIGNQTSSSDWWTVYTTPPESSAVTIKIPLKYNCPPNESLRIENEPLPDRWIMPNIFSIRSPDEESNWDKPNETGSFDKESPLAQTPADDPRTPHWRSQKEKSTPARLADYILF